MLGPLPMAYRVAVTVYTFIVFIAFGVWAAHILPMLALTGATIGAGLGGIAVLLLLRRDPHPALPRTHPPTRGW